MEKNQMMDMHVEMGLDSENVIDSSSLDPLFEEAARIIVTMRSGFASLIQRRLSIGYDRAVRIMDQLEKAEIVPVAQGSKPREVKIQDENSLENLLVALRRITKISNILTNEEAYKDIVNLLKQKGDKRYIAVPIGKTNVKAMTVTEQKCQYSASDWMTMMRFVLLQLLTISAMVMALTISRRNGPRPQNFMSQTIVPSIDS